MNKTNLVREKLYDFSSLIFNNNYTLYLLLLVLVIVISCNDYGPSELEVGDFLDNYETRAFVRKNGSIELHGTRPGRTVGDVELYYIPKDRVVYE